MRPPREVGSRMEYTIHRIYIRATGPGCATVARRGAWPTVHLCGPLRPGFTIARGGAGGLRKSVRNGEEYRGSTKIHFTAGSDDCEAQHSIARQNPRSGAGPHGCVSLPFGAVLDCAARLASSTQPSVHFESAIALVARLTNVCFAHCILNVPATPSQALLLAVLLCSHCVRRWFTGPLAA